MSIKCPNCERHTDYVRPVEEYGCIDFDEIRTSMGDSGTDSDVAHEALFDTAFDPSFGPCDIRLECPHCGYPLDWDEIIKAALED